MSTTARQFPPSAWYAHSRPAFALVLVALTAVLLGSLSYAANASPLVDSETFVSGGIDDTGHDRWTDDDCESDHEHTDCSVCPMCSGTLHSSEGDGQESVAHAMSPVRQSSFEGVVPEGPRRPPRR